MANWYDEAPVAPQAAPQSQGTVNWWDEASAQETAPVEPEAWNPLLGLSRDVVNGIPVLGPMYTGAVDAASTGLMGLLTGEDPQAIKDRVYARQDQYEAENPILSTAGQLVGGTAAMAPLGMTAAGARALGIAPGQGLMSRLLFGGGSGSAISGADSLARGNDPMTAGMTALGGGLIGAGGGAVAPYIGAAVSKAGDVGRKALGLSATPGNVGISKPAADILTDILNADGVLGNQAAANMSQAGPRAMLADAGPNATSLLDVISSTSGPGSRVVKDAVEARASAANDDILAALNASLGEPQGVFTTQTALRTGSAPARDAAYKAAYASPIDYSSDAGMAIEGLMQRVPQSAIAAANNLMKVEGSVSPQIMAKIADDGTVTFLRMPSVEQIDYITRGLNAVAKGTEGTGTLGGMTDIGRAYGNLAREIRTAAKEAAPAYANALETAATPIGQREALQFGSDLLSPRMARDEAASVISGMSGPERQYAAQGVRSQIDEAIANVRAVASDPSIEPRQARKALQDLSSPAAREKLAMLLGPDEAETLFRQLDEATQSLVLRANVATNSRTFARTALNDRVQDYVSGGVLNQAMEGKPVNATQAIIQNLTGRTPQGKAAISDKVYEEIARLLVQSPDAAMDLISGLGARQALAGNPRIGAALAPGAANVTTQQIAEMLLGGVAQ